MRLVRFHYGWIVVAVTFLVMLLAAGVRTVPQSFPLTPAVETHHAVDRDDEMAEHMMTGLRLTREGISMSGFEQRFGVPIIEVYGPVIERFEQQGLLCREADTPRLTPRARLLSNQIFVEFMP
jgi:oxygen-independent coproporphyrinogen-3 oxidase